MKQADLNPALGFPGGPCYLEERVDQVVKNPKVKQDILEPLIYCLILATLLGYRLWRRRHDLAAVIGE